MGNRKIWEPLARDEVIKAVERNNPSRIPLVMAKWWGEGLVEEWGARLGELDCYPNDVEMAWIQPLDINRMNLSWERQAGSALDNNCVIQEWSQLDEFIEKLPDPQSDPQFEKAKEIAERAHADNRYLFVAWWNLFFERPWSLRGMQNIMIDYYTEPEMVMRLHRALAEQYCLYLEAAVREFKPDGFWTSDDLGHQTGPMMSPEIFHEFLLPYYQMVSRTCHANNLHFWLHSCGDNTSLLPDIIAGGVDVFHPVQKHTMNELKVAQEFGDNITFLAGIDVQHTLQEKSPKEVRQEVRFLMDTFDKPQGGMCLAAGNGIVSGTPFDNIAAYLDEALVYGSTRQQRLAV